MDPAMDTDIEDEFEQLGAKFKEEPTAVISSAPYVNDPPLVKMIRHRMDENLEHQANTRPWKDVTKGVSEANIPVVAICNMKLPKDGASKENSANVTENGENNQSAASPEKNITYPLQQTLAGIRHLLTQTNIVCIPEQGSSGTLASAYVSSNGLCRPKSLLKNKTSTTEMVDVALKLDFLHRVLPETECPLTDRDIRIIQFYEIANQLLYDTAQSKTETKKVVRGTGKGTRRKPTAKKDNGEDGPPAKKPKRGPASKKEPAKPKGTGSQPQKKPGRKPSSGGKGRAKKSVAEEEAIEESGEEEEEEEEEHESDREFIDDDNADHSEGLSDNGSDAEFRRKPKGKQRSRKSKTRVESEDDAEMEDFEPRGKTFVSTFDEDFDVDVNES